MDRYARGDDAAFGEVYDKLAPRLYGFLLRHTRDRAKAEDVVQQTMLQIHRARGRFLPGAEVTPLTASLLDYLVTLEFAQPVKLRNVFVRQMDAFVSELYPPQPARAATLH